MKETKTRTTYDSPRVKVVEIKARQILCGSPNGALGSMEQSNDGVWQQ